MSTYTFPENLSRLLPEPLALELAAAAAAKNIERIDSLTDKAAALGLVRPRDDMSMAAEWQRRRDIIGLQAALRSRM